ncbi:substrate-binding periplasmic protein [Vibrio marisflavi]|uniref:Solute-binding protein family 3/N-terminal domain-containing protein n=1 Tax=Vibrio marisflavi CECT 7928 TaxID=634439 RepID=A0ABM8ZZA1_9VIBR|nr:transporter substrate-binding domain-containing protein [Vibrio marisflavi]CAH0536320.1 hypothetical protein VMF7928_00332 [Vibrio marisflavi CECT 7928]
MNKWIVKFMLTVALLFSTAVQAETFTLLTEALPPYAYKSNGQLKGVAVDIVSQLFRNAGFDYKVRIVPWKRAYTIAYEQSNTCVFPVQRNQEREAEFHWVSPLLITQTAFYTNANSKVEIRTLNDVANLNIGSYLGSATAQYLESQGFKVEETTRDEQNILKLKSKRIDVWATDVLVANYLLKQEKLSKEIKNRLAYFSTLRGLACNKTASSSDIDRLSDELRKMYLDGSVERIIKKYSD